MFDAGAVLGRLLLDRTQWEQSMKAAQKSVQDLGDRLTRMNRGMNAAFDRVGGAIVSAGQHVRRLGNEISQTSQKIAFLGAALAGPMMMAFNAMKDISPQVSDQMERLKNVIQNFQLVIAEAILPIVERFINALSQLLQWFNALDSALRTQILQWILIGGVLAIVAGTVGALTGKLISLAGSFLKVVGSVIGFLGPWGFLLVAIVGVIAAFGKLDETVRIVLSGIETVFYAVLAGILRVGQSILGAFESITWALEKFYDLLGKLPGKLGEPYRNAAKSLHEFRDDLKKDMAINEQVIQGFADKGYKALTGQGSLVKGFDYTLDKVQDVRTALQNLGNVKIDFAPVTQKFLMTADMIKETWGRVASSMSNMFSNLFYDAMVGQLKSLKDYFADFGRQVLQIISQVLARLLLAKLFGSLGGPIGSAFAALAGGGHAEGIEQVPETGTYRLHAGEKVVPKYDANKGQEITFEMYNVIAPETVARAMQSKAGDRVIVNAFTADSQRNGPIRKTVRRG